MRLRHNFHSIHPQDVPLDVSKPLGQAVDLRVNSGFGHNLLHDTLLQLLHLRLAEVKLSELRMKHRETQIPIVISD